MLVIVVLILTLVLNSRQISCTSWGPATKFFDHIDNSDVSQPVWEMKSNIATKQETEQAVDKIKASTWKMLYPSSH